MDSGVFQLFASTVLLLFAGAIGRMWLAHLSELKECKEDRISLRTEVKNMSKQIGRMEGHLEAIDERHDKAFKSGGSEQIETKT